MRSLAIGRFCTFLSRQLKIAAGKERAKKLAPSTTADGNADAKDLLRFSTRTQPTCLMEASCCFDFSCAVFS
jgi:hypothetical protein